MTKAFEYGAGYLLRRYVCSIYTALYIVAAHYTVSLSHFKIYDLNCINHQILLSEIRISDLRTVWR